MLPVVRFSANFSAFKSISLLLHLSNCWQCWLLTERSSATLASSVSSGRNQFKMVFDSNDNWFGTAIQIALKFICPFHTGESQVHQSDKDKKRGRIHKWSTDWPTCSSFLDSFEPVWLPVMQKSLCIPMGGQAGSAGPLLQRGTVAVQWCCCHLRPSCIQPRDV